MPRKRKQMPDRSFYRDLGRTIRLSRVAAGRTQIETAGHLDVTFQQLQKYEAGSNRIPFDRLVRLSAYLEVPLSHFVSTAPCSDRDAAFHLLAEGFRSREFHTLVEAWKSIKDRQMRAAILNLIKRTAALG
jgi:transcriptional regulator with XRE-family HTH domain